jgi:3-deoxy-D-manno-octulosonic-acid transferase
VLAQFDALSMQSREDVGRIKELGASEDKVYNHGNTKFDQEYGVTEEEAKKEIYQEYKLDPQQPILVAGSTHEGEEEELITVYNKLKSELPELVLI